MKRMILVVLAASAVGSVALAQGASDPRPCPGPGNCAGAAPGAGPRFGRGGGPAGRNYDPATVTTVSGTVEAVERGPGGGGQGIHAQLKTADGMVDVHLGPAWFLEEQKLTVAKGDALTVTGSKRESGQQSFVIAKEVKKGEASVTLRDDRGVPRWAGARRK